MEKHRTDSKQIEPIEVILEDMPSDICEKEEIDTWLVEQGLVAWDGPDGNGINTGVDTIVAIERALVAEGVDFGWLFDPFDGQIALTSVVVRREDLERAVKALSPLAL